MPPEAEARADSPGERRGQPDRRRRVLYSLLVSAWTPRRRAHRRGEAHLHHPLDHHESRWLAVAMLILVLSVTDAFLTLRLLELGAVEVNPLMDALLRGHGAGFAYWKVGLSAGGVVILTVLARLRVFGRVPVGAVLYAVLGLYAALIAYETWLLETLSSAG